MKKKIQVIYIMVLLLLSVLLEVRLAYLESRQSALEIPEGSYSVLYGDYTISTVDYEIDGNQYHATSVDPQIYVNGLSGTVQTIGLDMTTESDIAVQVYYPDENGALSEGNSRIQTVYSGENITIISIPPADYPFVRIDINGDFVLNDIQFSSEPTVQVTVTGDLSTFSLIQVIANLVVLLLVHGAVMYKYGTYGYAVLVKKIAAFLRRRQTITAAGVCVCAALAVVLLELVAGGGVIQNGYRLCFELFAVLALLLCVQMRRAEIETLFLALSLTSGILLSVILPLTTNVSWDDQIHYQRALQWTSVDEAAFTQADLDMCRMTYTKTEMMDAATRDDAIESMDADYKASTVTFSSDKRTLYQAVGYAPTILGLQLGRLLDLPYHLIFVLGRLANAIFYSVEVYFAIKITPVGKRILTVVGLLPTCVFLAANYSYDPWVTSMTMLWVAMLFRAYVREEERFTLKQFVPMLVVYVLACGPKQVYLTLGCMFLLLIWKKVERGQRKPYYVAGGLALLCITVSLILPFIMNIGGYSDMRGGTDVNAAEQVAYIFTNPLEYTETLLSFAVRYISPDRAREYMAFFAYLGNTPHFLLLLVLLWVVVFIDRNENDSILLASNVNRGLVLLLMFCTVCLISTALYISFTPVGASSIVGVQPRYLLPLVFPTLVYLGSSRIKNEIPKHRCNLVVASLSGAILFYSIWTNVVWAYTG